MSATPRVSVLMTVYNGLPYLEQSLLSIQAQTFRDYEFLIVDDASSDGSVELVQRYASEDFRIRLIVNTQNKGQTLCLNQGLAEARGVWVARQDADDLSDPRRLELQMRFLDQRPHLGLLGTNGHLIDAEGRSMGTINAPFGEDGVRWSSLFYNPFIHTSVCFRREATLALGGYDASFRIAQDYDLWMRLMKTHPADNLSERLVTYRVHPKSLSNSDRETTTREANVSCQLALESLGLSQFSDPESLALISNFREGLAPASRQPFWHLHAQMGHHFQGDISSAVALLHWKAAGSLSAQSKFLALQEIACGFLKSPTVISQKLLEITKTRAAK